MFFNRNKTEITFEDATSLEITKQTVRFRNSVYQFKNVSGFKVGEIPKGSFPYISVGIFTIIGLINLVNNDPISIISFLIAGVIAFLYLSKEDKYGLIIFLNSGHERAFLTHNKDFQQKIAHVLYDFMEKDKDEMVIINMNNKTIEVTGNVTGSNLNTGDEATIHKD